MLDLNDVIYLNVCNIVQVAGSLVLDLNDDGVFAEPAEADDRRNVFQLNTAKQRR